MVLKEFRFWVFWRVVFCCWCFFVFFFKLFSPLANVIRIKLFKIETEYLHLSLVTRRFQHTQESWHLFSAGTLPRSMRYLLLPRRKIR